MGLLVSLIIGGISGWIAGQLMHSRFTLLGNVILGVVGGVVGAILLGLIGIHGSGVIGSIIVGVVGACALIAVGRALKK